MAKAKVYGIGGIEGYGRTKTEARERAEEKAAELHKNVTQGPAGFPFPLIPGTDSENLVACVVLPGAYGDWAYYWIDKIGMRQIMTGIESRGLALYKATEHALALCLNAETSTADLDTLEDWLASIFDRGQAVTMRAEARGKVLFYRRYAAAISQGLSKDQAHQAACQAA